MKLTWMGQAGLLPEIELNIAPSAYTPLGDIATFEDVSNAVYFLGCEQSRNTTGAELTVDGGNMIRRYPMIPN